VRCYICNEEIEEKDIIPPEDGMCWLCWDKIEEAIDREVMEENVKPF